MKRIISQFLKQWNKQPAAVPLRLLHATHLRSNLPEILQQGLVHSFSGLVRLHGYEGALIRCHDRKRYDLNHALHDFLNISIGRVSSAYLYRLSGKIWKSEWVAIEFENRLLEWKEFQIAPYGAASLNSQILTGETFEQRKILLAKCFEQRVGNVDRETHEVVNNIPRKLSPELPTHPNCELLLSAPIGKEYWKQIVVADAAMRRTVLLQVEKSLLPNLPVKIDPEAFRWHPAVHQIRKT